MNPLEALKQKLRVKPVVEEKERVAVVIKGEQKKTAEPKKKIVAKEKDVGDRNERSSFGERRREDSDPNKKRKKFGRR